MHNGCEVRQRMFVKQVIATCVLLMGGVVSAEEQQDVQRPQTPELLPFTEDMLTERQWNDLDRTVDRGLEYLATKQRANGSFEAPDYAQPAVTSFCVMAFLSRGHIPGAGPYGEQLGRAIEFVLTTQQPSGMFFNYPRVQHEWNIQSVYNHAITGVMLGEVYGMTDAAQQERLRVAIEKSLEFTRKLQQRPKRWPEDNGGWKYMNEGNRRDADLSLTVWHLMFYRSARNAGFAVPESDVRAAVDYVKRCFDTSQGTFQYDLVSRRYQKITRAMAGAGILSLSLAGEHQSEIAQQAARYVLARPFAQFNRGGFGDDGRYFYAAYHCSQGMFQLGGDDWKQFYTVLLKALAENQRRDGSWEPDSQLDSALGDTYSTSLAVLALTPPYQILPVYQR